MPTKKKTAAKPSAKVSNKPASTRAAHDKAVADVKKALGVK